MRAYRVSGMSAGHYDTIGLTNYFGNVTTNDTDTNILGWYDLTFTFKTNKTYEVTLSPSDLQVNADTIRKLLHDSALRRHNLHR